MPSIDDELDDFLATSSDDNDEMQLQADSSDDDFQLKSDDERELQKVAADLEPNCSSSQSDKENLKPEVSASSDEEDNLQQQILKLQKQLELKKSKKRKNTLDESSTLSAEDGSQERENISQLPAKKKSKLSKKADDRSKRSFASLSQNDNSLPLTQKTTVTATNSMLAPISKSISEKQTIKSAQAAQSQIIHEETVYSNLHYTNAITSKVDFTKNVVGKEYKNLHKIPPGSNESNDNSHTFSKARSRASEKDQNWFTIAVIISQVTKKSAKGNDFTILKITNLFNCPETHSLFLFGNANAAFTGIGKRLQDTALIAILSPKILPQMNDSQLGDNSSWKNQNSQKSSTALSVTSPSQIIVLGNKCTDFGYCSGQNWAKNQDGKFVKCTSVGQGPSKCKNFINIGLSNLCAYHLSQSSKKITSNRGLFNSTSKPIVVSEKNRDKSLKKTMDPNFNRPEQSFKIFDGEKLTINRHSTATNTNPKNSSANLKLQVSSPEDPKIKTKPGVVKQVNVLGGSKAFNKSLNKITPGALAFKKHLEQRSKAEMKNSQGSGSSQGGGGSGGKQGNEGNDDVDPGQLQKDLNTMNSINRITDRQKIAASYQLKGSDLRKAAKQKAIAALKTDVKGNSRINKILERVNLNRQAHKEGSESFKKGTGSVSVLGSASTSSTPKKDYKDLINKKSKFEGQQTKQEERQLELYFSALEKKDEKLFKDLKIQKEDATVLICHDCKYTFWTVHPNCRANFHNISSKSVKKKFFNCSCNQRRVVTWRAYPTERCGSCGKISWQRAGKILFHDTVKLDTEKLVRFEEQKYINSLS